MEDLELLTELLTDKKYSQVRTFLLSQNAIDIAYLLTEIPPEKLLLVFRLLPKELAAEVFVEMDSDQQMLLIKGFNDTELHAVFNELFVDDTVDIIEEMPANVVKRILAGTDAETRKSINEILNYPDDSAGSIMTVEFVHLKPAMTIHQALSVIKKTGVDKETIYTCYVTDPNRHLIGVVTVKDMLLSEENATIGDIMEENIIHAHTLDDREEVANLFREYGLMALPVVDNEDRLVGIVTYDDAIDVLVEESDEDAQVMAAITPSAKPYLKTGVFDIWKNRIPWLLIMMLSATFTGMIISGFESALAAQVALTAFIPMLMSTGGNTGSQSSTTVIRGLSMGEVEFSDIFRVIWKEIRVGVLCAVTLAGANFIKIWLFDILLLKTEGLTLWVDAVVCITLALTVITAKLVGCTLPILAKKIKLDPAVMAAPFITTILDAVSLLIYFALASAILDL
ncbi:MAG: magnesium transporter [Clostridia bacterium]|nr:magnesium transporter [Clostridia bacterium]